MITLDHIAEYAKAKQAEKKAKDALKELKGYKDAEAAIKTAEKARKAAGNIIVANAGKLAAGIKSLFNIVITPKAVKGYEYSVIEITPVAANLLKSAEKDKERFGRFIKLFKVA